MPIVILFDVQDSQNAVVSFEKGFQNHSPSGFHHPDKIIPLQQNFWFPPTGGIYPPPPHHHSLLLLKKQYIFIGLQLRVNAEC